MKRQERTVQGSCQNAYLEFASSLRRRARVLKSGRLLPLCHFAAARKTAMRLARAFLVGFGACLLILANPAISSAAGDDDVLAAVLRGLGAVERGGVAWMDTKHCMSCHTFTFTLWAHREARQEGLANHPEKLDKWIGWAKDEAPGKRPWFKIVQRSFAALEADGVPEPGATSEAAQGQIICHGRRSETPLAGILSPDEQAQHGRRS